MHNVVIPVHFECFTKRIALLTPLWQRARMNTQCAAMTSENYFSGLVTPMAIECSDTCTSLGLRRQVTERV